MSKSNAFKGFTQIHMLLASLTIIGLATSAFASTHNIEEITHANGLSTSKSVIAQGKKPGGSLKDDPVFSQALASAESAMGNVTGIAKSQAVGGPKKDALAESLAQASTLIGNAAALSSSTAISDKKAVASSLSQAETLLGDALSIAQSNAISGPGKPAIAKSLSIAKTAVGNATAIAESSAQSGSSPSP
jgi:hypothetical protein